MAIDFDWEFEEDYTLPEERPTAKATSARRIPLWAAGLVVGVVAAVAVGWATLRQQQQQVASQLREALEAAVYAETLALRIGDEAAFMQAQSPESGNWRDSQEFLFHTVRESPNTYTGEISSLNIAGDAARVTHIVETGDGPVPVTWFYTYQDDTWLHAPLTPERWRTLDTLEGERVILRYDETFTGDPAELLADLDRMVTTLCERGVSAETMPPLEVVLATDSQSDPAGEVVDNALVVPPTRQNPVGDLHDQWARLLLGDAYEFGEMAWLEASLAGWLDGTTSYSFLEYFEAIYGDSFVPDLFERLHQGEEAQAAVQALLSEALGSRDQPPDAATLDAMLRAEQALRETGYILHASELFFDPEQEGAFLFFTQRGAADLFTVTGSHQTGDVVWADVRLRLAEGYDGHYLGQQAVMTIPFVYTEGRWYRTSGPPTDPVFYATLERDGVSVLHADLDAAFAGDVANVLLELRPFLVRDLGLTGTPTFSVVVGTPDLPALPADCTARNDSTHPTEAVTGDLGGTTQEAHLNYTVPRIIHACIAAEAELETRESLSALVTALATRTAQRYGFAGLNPLYERYVADEQPAVPQLVDLWQPNTRDIEDFGMQVIGSKVLFDVIADQYGEAAVPPLVDALGEAESMDDWLQAALNVDHTAVEAAWQSRMDAVMLRLTGGTDGGFQDGP
ncbi:MAG: hypothetical protein ACFB51_16885 [Anaerolineae bacterium]